MTTLAADIGTLSVTMYPAAPIPPMVRTENYQNLIWGSIAFLATITEVAGTDARSMTPEEIAAVLRTASKRLHTTDPDSHRMIVQGYNFWAAELLKRAETDTNARSARNKLLDALQTECIRDMLPFNYLRALAFPISADHERLVRSARAIRSVIAFCFGWELPYEAYDLAPESVWSWLEESLPDTWFAAVYPWIKEEFDVLYAHATGHAANGDAAIDYRLERIKEVRIVA